MTPHAYDEAMRLRATSHDRVTEDTEVLYGLLEEDEDAMLELEEKLAAATRLVALYESERELRGQMTVVAYAVVSIVSGALAGVGGWLLRGGTL